MTKLDKELTRLGITTNQMYLERICTNPTGKKWRQQPELIRAEAIAQLIHLMNIKYSEIGSPKLDFNKFFKEFI